MNFTAKAALTLALGCALGASAQNPWLNIYYPKGSDFKQWPMSQVLEITFDEQAGTMTVTADDNSQTTVSASQISHFVIGKNTPSLRITTDDPYYTEVPSKDYYISGSITFDGMGIYDDISTPMRIRGRGNSTWSMSKKPYRLKFDEKLKFGPVKKSKNLVLLANALDPSTMRNFVAFATDQLVGMPYPHHAMPVNVWFNDIYKGTYMATEQSGFNAGSVDLAADVEAKSVMFEFDTYDPEADEYPFDTDPFDSDTGAYLPARFKAPDAPLDETECDLWVDKWASDLNNFMALVDAGNPQAIFQACDVETLARYILVNNIACNQEIDHPKSTYMYKTEGGKYYFGPAWDFDWAFGYQPTYSKTGISAKKGQGGNVASYPSYENPLIGYGKSAGHGGLFFYRLCSNEIFQTKFKEVWDDFYNNKLSQFWQMFDEYIELLRPSINLDGLNNSRYRDFDTNVQNLRSWVENRIEFINSDANHGLWEEGAFDDYAK